MYGSRPHSPRCNDSTAIVNEHPTNLNGGNLAAVYKDVRVKMRVKSDASTEELRELAMFSAVYDIVSNPLPVEFALENVDR